MAEVLSALESLGTSKIVDASVETTLQEVLQGRGNGVSKIGNYSIFADFSDNTESVVFVRNQTGGAVHKYIIANAVTANGGQQSFVVCMPIEWTPMHRDILVRIKAATGVPYHCPGGGFVEVQSDGQLVVGGQSGDFGTGDHERAREALQRAVLNSAARNGNS
jgi:hypothetical protein